jgi:hypothetical protein
MLYNGKEMKDMDEHEFLLALETMEYNFSKVYEYMSSLGFHGKQLSGLYDYWNILCNHKEMAKEDVKIKEVGQKM